jgi:hypothetical protein
MRKYNHFAFCRMVFVKISLNLASQFKAHESQNRISIDAPVFCCY